MSRVLALLLPAALVAAGVAVPTAAVRDGGRTLEGWWLAALGVAAIPAVLGRGALRRPALLAALLLLGTAGQLALHQPHWLQFLRLHPRHYQTWVDVLAPVAVAVQAVVVLRLALPRLGGWLRVVRSHLTPLRALAALALFGACAVHYSLRVDGVMGTPRLLAQLATTGALFALNVAHVALIAAALPGSACGRIAQALGRWSTSRRVPWLLAAWTLLVTASLAWLGYGRIPHIPDELGYLFHAHYLAAGMLSAPVPPVPEAFELYLLTVFDGHWYCTMAPGWPAVLALGTLAGAEWLVNPVLAALCIPAAHAVTRRVLDLGSANAVAALLAVSPWFLFLGASFMNHTLSLLLTLCGWLLLLRASESRATWQGLLAGLCIGALFSIRKADCAAVAAATGIGALVACHRQRLPLGAVLGYVAGGAAAAAALLPYDAHLTGDAFTVPLSHYYDRIWYPGANRLGFGADVANHAPAVSAACPPAGGWASLDPLPGHGWIDVLLNANQNLYNVNFELLGWVTGSLVLVVVFWLWGRWNAIDRLALLLTALIAAVYGLYWFSGGPDFGARYWFLMITPMVWWTGRGAATLTELLRSSGLGHARARVAAAVVLLCAASVTLFLPWRCTARYVGYRGANPDYRAWLEDGTFENGLVLVKSSSPLDWGNALILNAPDLAGPGPVFAQDLGPESNRRVIEAFPDRPVFRVEGRSVTKGKSRILGRAPPGG